MSPAPRPAGRLSMALRIGFIGISSEYTFGDEVFRGYEYAMTQAGLEVLPEYIVPDVFKERDGIVRVLELTPRPTAIFAACDEVAMDVIRIAERKGIWVPRMLSVIGMDDVYVSSIVSPPLTTVRIDRSRMGRTAVQLLFERIRGKGHMEDKGTMLEVIPNYLVIRESCCPPERH